MAEDNGRKGAIAGFFKGVRSEFRKIVWPTKDDLVKQSLTVIVSSVLLGGIIAGLDWVFQILLSFILK